MLPLAIYNVTLLLSPIPVPLIPETHSVVALHRSLLVRKYLVVSTASRSVLRSSLMLYPVIGTLSNVYGADHISKTLDPLRTVAVRSLTGASINTSIYHNNMTSITLAHSPCILNTVMSLSTISEPLTSLHDILVLLLSSNAIANNICLFLPLELSPDVSVHPLLFTSDTDILLIRRWIISSGTASQVKLIVELRVVLTDRGWTVISIQQHVQWFCVQYFNTY